MRGGLRQSKFSASLVCDPIADLKQAIERIRADTGAQTEAQREAQEHLKLLIRHEIMCRDCLAHGLSGALISDLYVPCPVHQAASLLPALPRGSWMNTLCIVLFHTFPWVQLDDLYCLMDLVDDLQDDRIDLDAGSARHFARLCGESADRCRRYARRPLLSGRFGRRRAQRAQRIAAGRQERRKVANLLARLFDYAAAQLLRHAEKREALIGWSNIEMSKLVHGEALTTELGRIGSYNAGVEVTRSPENRSALADPSRR